MIIWLFPVSLALIRHRRNESNMIGNGENRVKLSKANFGVGQISKNESTVVISHPFSRQNGANGTENFT